MEAKGLLLLIDYKFVALLNVMCHVLGLIQTVSAQWQSASLDTAKAVNLVDYLVVCLRELRDTDNGLLDQFFADAEVNVRQMRHRSEA